MGVMARGNRITEPPDRSSGTVAGNTRRGGSGRRVTALLPDEGSEPTDGVLGELGVRGPPACSGTLSVGRGGE